MNIKHSPYEIISYGETEFSKFLEYLEKGDFGEDWVFRAQPTGKNLSTTLERAIYNSGFEDEVEIIEKTMLREFRRLYDGHDIEKVRNDTLYCLSLLRHHGAPSRLLDFTYSKYVALYFGLQCAYDTGEQSKGKPRSFALWFVNTKELNSKVEMEYGNSKKFIKAFKSRGSIETREDKSFKYLYMSKKPYRLVISENPALLHQRLHLQQGVFLCPGNIKESFMCNILFPFHNQKKIESIKQVACKLSTSDLHNQFMRLRRMNITHESLFPGLDGLARSMEYQISFYKELATRIRKHEGW